MIVVLWLKSACEYLGGERDEAPVGLPWTPTSVFWGLWWGVLAWIVYLFCGQSSKFIYIDF